eukprot:354206-Chlamydomonas_euryale.AAC.13
MVLVHRWRQAAPTRRHCWLRRPHGAVGRAAAATAGATHRQRPLPLRRRACHADVATRTSSAVAVASAEPGTIGRDGAGTTVRASARCAAVCGGTHLHASPSVSTGSSVRAQHALHSRVRTNRVVSTESHVRVAGRADIGGRVGGCRTRGCRIHGVHVCTMHPVLTAMLDGVGRDGFWRLRLVAASVAHRACLRWRVAHLRHVAVVILQPRRGGASGGAREVAGRASALIQFLALVLGQLLVPLVKLLRRMVRHGPRAAWPGRGMRLVASAARGIL